MLEWRYVAITIDHLKKIRKNTHPAKYLGAKIALVSNNSSSSFNKYFSFLRKNLPENWHPSLSDFGKTISKVTLPCPKDWRRDRLVKIQGKWEWQFQTENLFFNLIELSSQLRLSTHYFMVYCLSNDESSDNSQLCSIKERYTRKWTISNQIEIKFHSIRLRESLVLIRRRRFSAPLRLCRWKVLCKFVDFDFIKPETSRFSFGKMKLF